LNLNKVKDINLTDIQQFASLVFEMKKPIKMELISYLNERYGINVQNLKDPATFKGLLSTQSVIFESLAKISPKKSVQRDVLLSLAESLSAKNGVEAIDCNEVIQEVFIAAGYDDLVINESLNNYLDFEKIASDLDKVGGILRMIKGTGAGAAAASMQQAPAQSPMASPEEEPEMAPDAVPAASGMEDDDVAAPALTPEDDEEGAESMGGMEDEEMGEEDAMAGEEEMGDEESAMAPEDIEPSEEEVLAKMSELESLIASLKSEIGGGEEEEEMPDEIDAEQEELEAEEEDLEDEHDELHDDEDEVEEKESEISKKQKKLEKKEDRFK